MLKSIFEARKAPACLLTMVLSVSLGADSAFAKPLGHGPKDQASDVSQIRTQVARLRPGTLIEIRFISKEKVRARLGESDAEGFTVQTQGAAASQRRIAFAEVRSLRPVQSTRGRVATWIVAGALIGVVAVALAILLKERSNE
jgi:hypothetical protein